MTEKSFRGRLQDTLGKKQFAIRVLFDPIGAWRSAGFSTGTTIVAIPLLLLTVVSMILRTADYYHIGLFASSIAVVLTILTYPTIVVPFIIGLIVCKLGGGHGSPLTLPMGSGLALLLSFLTALAIGGGLGWVVGHFIGLTKPKRLPPASPQNTST